jgi:hypothetical protein
MCPQLILDVLIRPISFLALNCFCILRLSNRLTLGVRVNNIISKDVVFKAEFCGIKLSTVDWNEPKYLQVYGFSDGIYNQQV